MNKCLYLLFSILVSLASSTSFSQNETQKIDLESNLVIFNPLFLRNLENVGFSINQILSIKSNVPKIANSDLFSDSKVNIIKETVINDINDFKVKNPNAGIGPNFSQRLFDVKNLSTSLSRFVLVGIINRQDRTYVNPATCGEIRLIYRLAYNVKVDNDSVMSRLPMTINLILKAKDENENIDCSVIANKWMKMNNYGFINNLNDDTQINTIASKLINEDSFLNVKRFNLNLVKAIEINMQVMRTPAVARPDFGANSNYLLRHFKWNKITNKFEISLLENQIDKIKISKSPELLEKLKLVIKNNIRKINDGTYTFPDEFLSTKALSLAPSGLKRIENRPFSNLITRDMIDKMGIAWTSLDRVKSTTGLLRRLNDLTCTGCHQTKSVAGFHFSGKDPQGKYPGNSAFLAGSPHFYGDLPRRQEILKSISKNQITTYVRGFAERPDDITAKSQLNSSGLLNGWGAHCTLTNDPTFSNWTCASGLKCTSLLTSDYDKYIGVCLSTNNQEVGQPCESGHIDYTNILNGIYIKDASTELIDKENFLCSPQSATPGQSTGGFPNGSIRRKHCNNLSSVEVCGVLPAGKEGFNSCISKSKNFLMCIKEYKANVGLRACDQTRVCRDDYICAESNTPGVGACLPPYFLFQFRVDGHPI